MQCSKLAQCPFKIFPSLLSNLALRSTSIAFEIAWFIRFEYEHSDRQGTTVHPEESPAWNPLHARFAMHRINHQHGNGIDGACSNGAESCFSRLRRAELEHPGQSHFRIG
jgi:hypothetical protein